ncbi:response regulator [Arthrobacter sp. 35W]|uniref:response regulator n=1 Tax=Arthrobacter sp. 35W TaxID=1132441 RepID=UPI0004035828|nr:response regulator [Arthrobacter sp. 35W]
MTLRQSLKRYPVRRARIDVSIIEDHRFLLEGLAAWLGDATRSINVVGGHDSWASAMGSIGNLGDVVLLDVVLGDSLPLGAKIRILRTAGAQVVVFSSLADPQVARQAMSAGALAYVSKAADAATVAGALEHAARGEVFLTDEVSMVQELAQTAVQLSSREHQVASLYLSDEGQSMAGVARSLGITVDGVKKHLNSVRRKYASTGSEIAGRLALRQLLIRDGWLIEARAPEKGPDKH